MLLSHAPGLCPVDCIEPEVCAITGERRFWEMRHTLATLTTALGRPDIAMFFCRHHCNVGQYDVGGIRFRTIYEESDRIMAAVRGGGQQFGVATFSSCHGVLNLFRVEGRPMTDAAIGSGGSARRTCQSCGAVFQCGPATGNSVCWCERRPHVLPAAGTACFCPACLEVLITEAITTQRKRPG